MIKKIRESTLRKRLMNRVLDLTPVELLNEYCKSQLGIYINADVDWDVLRGHSILTKFLPDEEQCHEPM